MKSMQPGSRDPAQSSSATRLFLRPICDLLFSHSIGGPPASAAWPARPLALQFRTVLVGIAFLFLAALLVRPAVGGTTNTVPWSDSFETYANGASIVGANGWSCEATNAALATTDAGVMALLAAYTNGAPGSRSYPLPATNHTTVLQTTMVVTNDVVGTNNGVVAVEFMVWPTMAQSNAPTVSTNLHYAIYVNTSSNLVIWHQKWSAGVTNAEWLALTNGPAVTFTNWSRVTVVQDYGHNMFQIRVNEATNAVWDPAGWSVPGAGGSQPGSWFHMVKTNAWMSKITLGGDDTNYVDDLVLARRSVNWSTNAFAETPANDGTIDTNTLFAIGVTYDTFAGTNGQVLDATAVTVTNLPAGLTGVVTRVDDTHLRLTLAGLAVSNEAVNGTSNITVVLRDSAFTLGNAADVTGRSNGTIAVTFLNSAGVGTLTASGTHFGEAAANDGTISNSLTLTLTVATFTNVSPLRAGTDYTIDHVPDGLQFVLDRQDATTAVARLTNHATTHTFSASLTNLNLTFLNAAFPGMAASNVIGSALSLAVDFRDPPVLGYSGTTFSEADANDGTLTNALTITLNGDTFSNTTFTSGIQYQAPSLPANLALSLVRSNATTVTATLTGSAAAHAVANNLASIGFAFLNPAFATVGAGNIVGSATNIALSFRDPPVVHYLGTAFTESAANDGTIANSNIITLTGATFTGAPSDVYGPGKVLVSNVPTGLTAVITVFNATQLVAQLTGPATAHRTINNTTALTVQFLNAAFNGVLASNITDSTRSDLSVTFNDAASLAYATNTFAELPANDGSVGGGTITLTGDTFAGSDGDVFGAGKVSFANVPGGLTGVLTRTSATVATISFDGKAAAHAAVNSIANLGVTFSDAAFAGGNVGDVANAARSDLGLVFADAPVVSAGGTNFVEVAANNGSIGNSNIITLVGGTFASGTFVANTHYTVANVPAGLTFNLNRDSGSQLTASLTGRADNHRATDGIGNLTVTFLDSAFNAVQAARVVGHPFTFAVTFSNPPALTYSRGGFSETSGGQIDNRVPLTITLSGDTFAGDVAGRVGVVNLPDGLGASFTRDSDTQVSVRLTGAATSHASGDSRSNLTFTFQAGAFAVTDNDQVEGYVRTNLTVTFVDDVGFFNVVPYGEPFEDYASGFGLAGTNGWTADYYADAGIVINDGAVTSNEMRYLRTHVAFPIPTNHVQAVSVQDNLRVAVHSESNQPLIYVDFMAQPAGLQEIPDSNTNAQYSFYVSTNHQVVIWHCNWTSPVHSNEWLTLQNGPLIDTSRWVRFTIAQDYVHNLFQLRVNEHDPIVDPAGWTDGGAAPTGSWFHMVKTNGVMSQFVISGTGQAYLDDLTVRTNLPSTFGGSLGNVFTFR